MSSKTKSPFKKFNPKKIPTIEVEVKNPFEKLFEGRKRKPEWIKSTLAAPLKKIPTRIDGPPYFEAMLYSPQNRTFFNKTQRLPLGCWLMEIVEFGDGLFVFGEPFGSMGMAQQAWLLLKNLDSKKQVFLDFLDFLQWQYEESHFKKVIEIESFLHEAHKRKILFFVGLYEGYLHLAYRESLDVEFTLSRFAEGCRPEEFSAFFNDMLASLQWGFRLREFEKKGYTRKTQYLNQHDFLWQEAKDKEPPPEFAMKHYFQKSADEHLKHLLQLSKKYKHHCAFKTPVELAEAFVDPFVEREN